MSNRHSTEINVRRLLDMFRRRWRMVAFAGIGGAIAAMAIPFSIGPRYTAKAQIVIDPQRAGSGEGHAVMSAMLDVAAIESHVAILTSDSQLRTLLDSLKSERDAASPTGARGSEPDFSRLDVDRLKRGFNAFKERQSRVIGVTYTSADKAIAASVVNRAVDLYLGSQIDRNRANRGETLKSLRDRIPLVKAELDRAETAAKSHRLGQSRNAAGGASLFDEQVADLTRQLAEARADLAGREARLVTVRDLQLRENGLALLVETLDDPGLKELQRQQDALVRSQPTDKAQVASVNLNGVRRSIQDAISRAVAQLSGERDQAEHRVRDLQQRHSMLQDAKDRVRKPELQQEELQREAAAFRRLYEDLLQRQKATLEESEIRVLSFATIPDQPSSPHPLLFALPGLMLATIGAGLLAVLLEQIDNRLRTEQDIGQALGLPCIGVLPRLSTAPDAALLAPPPPSARKAGGSADASHQRPGRTDADTYRDAVRAIAISAFGLSSIESRPRVVLVTSSISGEGKSTLAASLAAMAAELRRRVLLIDLDFGNSTLGAVIGLPRGADVTSLGPDLMALIRPVPRIGIDYLPLAAALEGASALLPNGEVATLLGSMKERYDCIVIDSGPLLGATEPRLIAPLADTVLLAVKWESTTGDVAASAVRMLEVVPCRKPASGEVARVVITQVDMKRHGNYELGSFGTSLLYSQHAVQA